MSRKSFQALDKKATERMIDAVRFEVDIVTLLLKQFTEL